MIFTSFRPHVLRVLHFWGVDRAVAYILIGRFWSVLAGPITIILLTRFLSPEEQGFYYTFGNILGLQIFFELGLTYVILNFASHEKAHLEWVEPGVLRGDPVAKGRLAALLRLSLVWYGVAAALVVVILLPTGLYFFDAHQPEGVAVAWRAPWVWVVLLSALSLLISPVFAVLDGCGLIAQLSLMRIGQSILSSLILWLALSQRWGLFASVALSAFGLLWALGWLFFYKRAFFLDLLPHGANAHISWWGELWPFQWKIALSWLSGYFIFSLFNPVLFAFHGAVAAGQMGMSLNLMGAISTMAMAWVMSKASPFGSLIARREYQQLDRMFFSALWQSTALVACGGAAFWLGASYLYYINHPLSQRILAPLPLGLLIAAAILTHIVAAEGVYLRSHKREPFLVPSIIGACLCSASAYLFGKQYGATGMLASYFVITVIVGLITGTWIFLQKRRLWHSDEIESYGENAA